MTEYRQDRPEEAFHASKIIRSSSLVAILTTCFNIKISTFCPQNVIVSLILFLPQTAMISLQCQPARLSKGDGQIRCEVGTEIVRYVTQMHAIH